MSQKPRSPPSKAAMDPDRKEDVLVGLSLPNREADAEAVGLTPADEQPGRIDWEKMKEATSGLSEGMAFGSNQSATQAAPIGSSYNPGMSPRDIRTRLATSLRAS